MRSKLAELAANYNQRIDTMIAAPAFSNTLDVFAGSPRIVGKFGDKENPVSPLIPFRVRVA